MFLLLGLFFNILQCSSALGIWEDYNIHKDATAKRCMGREQQFHTLAECLGLDKDSKLRLVDWVKVPNGHDKLKFVQEIQGFEVFESNVVVDTVYVVRTDANSRTSLKIKGTKQVHSGTRFSRNEFVSSSVVTALNGEKSRPCIVSEHSVNKAFGKSLHANESRVRTLFRKPTLMVFVDDTIWSQEIGAEVSVNNNVFSMRTNIDVCTLNPFLTKRPSEILEKANQGKEAAREDLEPLATSPCGVENHRKMPKYFRDPFRSPTSREKIGSSRQSRERKIHGAPCENGVFGTGGNAALGPIHYGRWPFCLDVAVSEDKTTCFLKNKYVRVYDLGHRLLKSLNQTVVAFPCSEGYHDQINGAASPALDAFFYVTETSKMLKDWFGYEPVDASPISVYVHYGVRVPKAFARWDRSLTFGDGGISSNFYRTFHLYPFASSPDTVAHETGHLITNSASRLDDTGTDGAMHESFSDLLAETFEFYLLGKHDWQIGFWVTKSGARLRDLTGSASPRHQLNHVLQWNKNTPVHMGAGIFNTAFKNIADKIGIVGTMEIALLANRIYWIKQSSFEDFACGIVQAACDMSYDVDRVAGSLRNIGIQFSACSDFSKFLPALEDEDNLTGVHVSAQRQPIYRVYLSPGLTSLVIQTNKRLVSIRVTLDYAGQQTATQSLGKMTTALRVPQAQHVYVRLTTKSRTDFSNVVLKAFINYVRA